MGRAAFLLFLALAASAPAAAQVIARAPEWARPLLVTDMDAVQTRQSVLAAPAGAIAARLAIAPSEGGVARLIRFEAGPAAGSLNVRRYTGQERVGWVLWGPEQATALPLDAAKRAQLERLARAALSAAVIGGESVGASAPCRGDYAWLELSEGARNITVERRCAMTGAVGAFIRALSDAAGSRDEEELYAAGVAELLEADRTMARAASAVGLPAAMAEYAGEGALAIPGASAALRGREAIDLFFAGVEPFAWTPAGAEVSARGDMGWSWGRWTRGEASGDYIAVWRRDGEGAWRYAARTGP
jgi:hypothetical protein